MRAVMVMPEALKAKRLKKGSDQTNVTLGTKSLGFFVETIIRTQEELKSLGYYQGESSGKFDIKTSDALSSFQLKHSIVATALRDQVSLFKLFN